MLIIVFYKGPQFACLLVYLSKRLALAPWPSGVYLERLNFWPAEDISSDKKGWKGGKATFLYLVI